MHRREFLIRTGWIAAGTTVLTSCSSLIPALPTTGEPRLEDGVHWIQALPDGRIRFFCPRMEMGQGASLGLAQLVAQELNVGQEKIECVTPRTDQVKPFQMTVGSQSIFNFAEPVSRGAAALRETLKRKAAEMKGVSHDQVEETADGFKVAGVFIGYEGLVSGDAEIVSPDATELPATYQPRWKSKKGAVGQRWKHHETHDIVTGRMTFSRDVVVPDMLHGGVLRPPRFGAQLKKVSADAVEDMPGVVQVVIDLERSFVGVVAETPFGLDEAVNALEAVWDVPEGMSGPEVLDVRRNKKNGHYEHTLAEDGDLGGTTQGANKVVSSVYETSFMSHAAMEPRASVVWVQNDEVSVWCGSQDPFFVQKRVAEVLNRKVEDVVVHSLRMGGGFGGKVFSAPSEEAALLSAAVGRPVKVQWTRETEFQQNYFQPKFSHALEASLDDSGKILRWRHDFVSGPIIFGMVPRQFAGIIDIFVADEGTARGALPPYSFANRRIRYSDIRTEIPTGAWRGLGAAPNAFAMESMMDEMAILADQDPLAFRLAHLDEKNHRLGVVLRRVGQLANWPAPEKEGRGLGVACAIYQKQTYVAVVAEVEIDHLNGTINATKLWCAQDSGLVINPDLVENQVLGNLTWGCSVALKEKMTFTDGVADQTNFDSYNILRHDEAPTVVIELVETEGESPSAVGESALAPTVAAIANAIYDATGNRPKRLPIDYESIFP